MSQRPLAVSFRTSQISSPVKDEDRPSHTLVDTKSPLSFGERVVLRTRMLIIDVERRVRPVHSIVVRESYRKRKGMN